MKRLLLGVLCTVPLLAQALAQAEDNLRPFLQKGPMFPHPICGINPNFDGQPKNFPPPAPFATCLTLAHGYGVDKSYADPGVEALAKLLIALAGAGGWEQLFKPVSEPPLNCRQALPPGVHVPAFPGAPATPQGPVCTLSLVRSYLADYDSQPIVKDFRRFEKNLRRLNLSDNATVEKVRQATAVIQATGSSITFKDVAELLE